MGKNKKQSAKETAAPGSCPDTASPAPEETGPAAPASAPSGETATDAPSAAPGAPLPKNRLRRFLPDLVKVGLALAVIGLGSAIWYKPPLIRSSFPYLTYRFEGQTHGDAALYRPLAMPTRYYIQLPRELAGRYTWFAVDRRREVAALTAPPSHQFWGQKAIKRSDSLGLDLEFRKLDNSEWQVHFFEDAIVFSNAVLQISMEANKSKPLDGK